MTKTIQNTNFVQFMHEVVDAIEAGYTLDYEPVNAPESTPSYKVTLVENLIMNAEDAKNMEELIAASAKHSIPEEPLLTFSSEPAPPQDVANMHVEQPTANKPQAGRPPRGARK